MTRPHEDIQHHTAVDHREGGPPIRFPANAWCAIDMLHTKTERAPAAVSAYETLIELARKSGMTVTLDARIGRQEYRTVHGSVAALERFSELVAASLREELAEQD